MRLSNGVRWLALATAIFASGQVAAQSTATLNGRIVDESGAAVSGTQIVITHQVSGTQNGALSQADGRYTVAGLRPGGPYRIEARMIGYGLQLVDDVNLLAVSHFLTTYPFADRLYPDSLDVIRHVRKWGPAVILSDGDVVFLQNPVHHLLSELGTADIVMQNDDRHDSKRQKTKKITLCTGFFLVSPNRRTQRLFDPRRFTPEYPCDTHEPLPQ